MDQLNNQLFHRRKPSNLPTFQPLISNLKISLPLMHQSNSPPQIWQSHAEETMRHIPPRHPADDLQVREIFPKSPAKNTHILQ
ncbi:hypothetical protein SAMN05421761_1025 [Belliella pelovolcani]|uniref:Uncharacterized protein n=1 Tax=Belliella pelovolcani TaxID=529505 RepID=A0A1N7KDV3_9BACT|nr:hypothetical protein SAMN05421761_1025 [Belliella pelovolcani]